MQVEEGGEEAREELLDPAEVARRALENVPEAVEWDPDLTPQENIERTVIQIAENENVSQEAQATGRPAVLIKFDREQAAKATEPKTEAQAQPYELPKTNTCQASTTRLEIKIDPKNKIDRSKLNEPSKPGNAPTFKKDGSPVEIHHEGQNPRGPFRETNKEEHRGRGNDKANHPQKSSPSKVDRKEFQKAKRDYWKKEYPTN